MKKLIMFSTEPWYFLTELPPLLFFIISIIYNNEVDGVFKLYPLIFALGGIMLFIGIYFFRAVVVSIDDVRVVGPFSSHDQAVIKKNRRLTISALSRRKLKIELFGISGDEQVYSWLTPDDKCEINLLRTKTLGGKNTIVSILHFYGVPKDDALLALNSENFEKEYEDIILKTEIANERSIASVVFKRTI